MATGPSEKTPLLSAAANSDVPASPVPARALYLPVRALGEPTPSALPYHTNDIDPEQPDDQRARRLSRRSTSTLLEIPSLARERSDNARSHLSLPMPMQLPLCEPTMSRTSSRSSRDSPISCRHADLAKNPSHTGFLIGENEDTKEYQVKGINELLGVLRFNWWGEHWTVLVIITYFVVGVIGGINAGMTPIDALYFTVVTVTTVGYGDLSPSGHHGLHTVGSACWVLASAFVIGAFVGMLLDEIMESEYKAVVEKAKHTEWDDEGQSDSDQHYDCPPPRCPSTGTLLKRSQQRLGRARLIYKESRVRLKWNLSKHLLQLLACLAAGTIIGLAEGWQLNTSFYWACVTISSVGYGDVVPTSQGGRVLATILMLCGVFAAAHCIGAILSYRSQMKEVRARERVLTQFGTEFTLEKFHTLAHGSEVRSLDLCTDEDNMTRSEFCLYMLVKMGRVSKEELMSCQDCFDSLDAGGDGKLDIEDVARSQHINEYARHSNIVRMPSDDADDEDDPLNAILGSAGPAPELYRSTSITVVEAGGAIARSVSPLPLLERAGLVSRSPSPYGSEADDHEKDKNVS